MLIALAALSLVGCGGRLAPRYAPPPLPTTAAQRIEHASTAGTIAALGTPTGHAFMNGAALGVILGPFGAAIAYASADADPPDVAIHPTPVYADTSAAYVLAFRRAYDAQVKTARRDAALGGGLVGMLVGGVIAYAILSHD